jgi:hypothetical protein
MIDFYFILKETKEGPSNILSNVLFKPDPLWSDKNSNLSVMNLGPLPAVWGSPPVYQDISPDESALKIPDL